MPKAERGPFVVSPPAGRHALPVGRWAVLLAVLGVELAAVTARHWWSETVGRHRTLTGPVACVAAGMAVFAVEQVWRRHRLIARVVGRAGFPTLTLVGQLAAYAGFVASTIALARSGPQNRCLGGLWLASGLAAGGLWLLAVAPAAVWVRVVRRTPGRLLTWAAAGLGVWLAAKQCGELWDDGTFAGATLDAVAWVLHLCYADTTCLPAERVVGANGFDVIVHDTCSGVEGLGLVVAFLAAYTLLCRRTLRFPHALLLVPLGLAASWVLNVLRIVALVAIGAAGRPEVAVGGFHSEAGWVAFNLVALGLVVVSRTHPFFRRPAAAPVGPPRGDATTAYLLPLVVVLGAAMLTRATSAGGFDALYPVRVAGVAAVVLAFRRSYARLGWSWAGVPAAAAVGLGVFVMWVGLEPPAAPTGPPAALATMPVWLAAGWVAARVVGGVVTVPLAEELAFRGYLMRVLLRVGLTDDLAGRVRWWAVVGSAVPFGLLHPGREAAGVLAGLAYAFAFARRGRVADAVIAHAVTNAALAGYVLVTGRWEMW